MPGDTVIVSASPIPGNERLVAHTLDNLFQQGARVFYSRVAEVHVPGHAGQEEMKLVMALTHPRYFVPVHGEYRHLVIHAQLAQSMGIPADNTFVIKDGDILELSGDSGKVVGNASSSYVYVDGLGDIGDDVLRDRKHLSRDGVLVVIIPFDKQTGQLVAPLEMLSRGFVETNAAELMEEAKTRLARTLNRDAHAGDTNMMQSKVRQVLGQFLWERTHRRPMILPIAIEV
jgi:ribonuclease J